MRRAMRKSSKPKRAAKRKTLNRRAAAKAPATNGALEDLGLSGALGGAAIGRHWLDARGPALPVRSPIDGRTLAVVNSASPADVRRVIDAAAEAFGSWRNVPAPKRGE